VILTLVALRQGPDKGFWPWSGAGVKLSQMIAILVEDGYKERRLPANSPNRSPGSPPTRVAHAHDPHQAQSRIIIDLTHTQSIDQRSVSAIGTPQTKPRSGKRNLLQHWLPSVPVRLRTRVPRTYQQFDRDVHVGASVGTWTEPLRKPFRSLLYQPWRPGPVAGQDHRRASP
jgi:hypothetical protein